MGAAVEPGRFSTLRVTMLGAVAIVPGDGIFGAELLGVGGFKITSDTIARHIGDWYGRI